MTTARPAPRRCLEPALTSVALALLVLVSPSGASAFDLGEVVTSTDGEFSADGFLHGQVKL